MMPKVRVLREAHHKSALVLSTKDRVAFTRRILPRLLSERGFDLVWCDGSETPEGRALPDEIAAGSDRIREIHQGVGGGPDAAIVYGLTRMLDVGYERVGLIENDVLLEPGWLGAILDLFRRGEADGLRVGAVSARTYRPRTLFTRPHYAVLHNAGAGMILFERAAARCVLDHYRTPSRHDIASKISAIAGPEVDVRFGPWQPRSARRERSRRFRHTSCDWYWDAVLMHEGWVVLGAVPSRARNIDEGDENRGGYLESPADAPSISDGGFRKFAERHRRQRELRSGETLFADVVEPCEGRFRWRAYAHQLLSADVLRLRGPWRLVWTPVTGPFSLRPEGPEAQILLNGVCGRVGLVCTWEEPGMRLSVLSGTRERTVRLRGRLKREAGAVTLPRARSGPRTIGIRVLPSREGGLPVFTFHGLLFRDSQPWLDQRARFDYSVIAPLCRAL